ncbi:MAG: glycosyltransferase [Rhodococcus sp. (in: high G+C Gram-positive bacteria)]
MTVLSSLPGPEVTDPFADWIELPMDTGDPTAADPTAHGVLHWAPTSTPGMTSRMATIADFVDRHRPRSVVVDVSVEVAVFVRLLGVRVTVFAMPGTRTDRAHRLGYEIADRIVAPWSDSVYHPEWLQPFDDKTVYAGCISRHADRTRSGTRDADTVAVLAGAGGSHLTTDYLNDVRTYTPSLHWRGIGAPGTPWVEDVWPLLTSAGVVVTHAGQNAVADVAASGSPAVVVAEDRPHDEQLATARALGDAGLAVALESWPDPSAWPAIIERARALTADIRATTRIDGAAARAARAVSEV